MPIVLNGSGTVTGISAGGLPDGIIQAADLASGVGGKVINYAQTLKKDVTSAVVAQGAISGALISLSYAAASSSNKLLLSYTIHIGLNTSTNCYGYLYIGGNVSSIIGDAGESNQKRATSTSQGVASHKAMIHSFQTLIDNPSTSSTTYDVRFGHGNNSNQTMFINNDSQNGNYNYYARFVSSLTILEMAV
tara:strand:- start:56 stop:628 length:573 start_codon:yes stop_codon:yes gene_type:complete